LPPVHYADDSQNYNGYYAGSQYGVSDDVYGAPLYGYVPIDEKEDAFYGYRPSGHAQKPYGDFDQVTNFTITVMILQRIYVGI
jgi:hypothetical protein